MTEYEKLGPYWVSKEFHYKKTSNNSKTVMNNLIKLHRGENFEIFKNHVNSELKVTSSKNQLTKSDISKIVKAFSNDKNRFSETAIKQVIRTQFDYHPEDFIYTSGLHLISNLFFTFDNSPFVLFNLVKKDTLESLDKIFWRVADQDFEYFLVGLYFHKKISSRSPLLYASPYSGITQIKGNKYPTKHVGELNFLNDVEHIYLPNFENFYYDFISKNMNKIDLSSKSKRLHFVRKFICNYSQNEFAKRLRDLAPDMTITSSTVSRWENDNSPNPLWYRKYKWMIFEVLKSSNNVFDYFFNHYGFYHDVHDEVIEDIIELDDLSMHRHVIDPGIQILSKYDKKSKNEISIEEEFRKSYIQVSTPPEVSVDYELSAFDVVTILNYFLSIQKRSLFADMKNANLDEKEMFETFKLWKKLNPTRESTD